MGTIPQPPEVLAAARGQMEDFSGGPACVDCAIEDSGPLLTLKAVFTVNGTVLCRNHAVLERTSRKTEETVQ